MSAKKDLHHAESYEWFGTFWFPDEPDKKFSGRLKYTLETGANLELLELFLPQGYGIVKLGFRGEARKTIHGIIASEAGMRRITLLNTSLYSRNTAFPTGTRVIKRNADTIIFDVYLEDSESSINGLVVEYNREFSPAICNFLEKKNQVGQGLNITWFEDETSYEDVYGSSSVDMKILICFGENKSINEFFNFERKIYFLWRVIFDNRIDVNRAWLSYIDEGKKVRYSMLCDEFRRRIQKGKYRHSYFGFPITKKNSHKLMSAWLEIFEDSNWNLVIEIIVRMLFLGNKFADKTEYVLLRAGVESLMNLFDYEKSKMVELFIKDYASEEWKKEIASVCNCIDSEEEIGKYIADVRNAIVHPKNKNIKAKFIANDPLKIHNLYICVFALFVKAIFMHIADFQKDDLDKFTLQFIEGNLLERQ